MAEHETESLRGVVSFFSETGTEGGLWAFQDERHIQKNVPLGFCIKCGSYLRQQQGREVPVCPSGAHEEKIGDAWDYAGLYVLEDGDALSIYDKDNPERVLWSGVVSLKQHNVFSEHVFGHWIHADQNGIEREAWAMWFFKEHPAMLTRKKKLPAPQ